MNHFRIFGARYFETFKSVPAVSPSLSRAACECPSWTDTYPPPMHELWMFWSLWAPTRAERLDAVPTPGDSYELNAPLTRVTEPPAP